MAGLQKRPVQQRMALIRWPQAQPAQTRALEPQAQTLEITAESSVGFQHVEYTGALKGGYMAENIKPLKPQHLK
jgi:hypothetical protein